MSQGIQIDRLEPRTHFAAGDPFERFGVGGFLQFRGSRVVGQPVDFAETASGKLMFTSSGARIARVNAADGTLDATFDGDGILNTFFSGIRDTAPIAGDRFWAVGYVYDQDATTPIEWYIARFRANGSLDRTFGSRGRTKIDAAGLRGYRNYDATIDGTGAVTFTASRRDDYSEHVMLRFSAAGTLDTAFADAGVLPLRTARALVAQTAYDAGGNLYQLIRPVRNGVATATIRSIRKLRPDGTLDTTFGGSGYLTARSDLQFRGLSVLDGALFVHAPVTQSRSSYLLKLDRNGGFDLNFGSGGKIKFELPAQYSSLRLYRQPDGKLLMLTDRWRRLNADGSRDSTFAEATIPGTLNLVGRNGVLYGASGGQMYATALNGDEVGPITLSSDGTLTLRGTRQADHLNVYQYAPDGTVELIIPSREGWSRRYDPAQVQRIVVDGGSGDDVIYVRGTLPVTVIGAAGNDRIDTSTDAPGVLISGGLGNDDIEASGEGFTVEGNDGDDSIVGRVGDNVRDRLPAISTLSGGRGNDKIGTSGGRGFSAFQVFGDEGDDYLRSGLTNDTLTGGPGRDTMRSGGGIDTIFRDDDDAP